jgi:glucoamylase
MTKSWFLKKTLCSLSLGLLISASAWGRTSADTGFESWLNFQEQQSLQKIQLNISPADTAPGVVVASPERRSPPYYYHWVRDAALTMDTIETLFERTSGSTQQAYLGQLVNYARFSRSNQVAQTLSGLAEPKFNVDGTPYQFGWCRPQNDGPALRALTLIHLANSLLNLGQTEFVKTELAPTVIKTDLDFVANDWPASGCDIWEETRGDHFYTRLVQWRALMEGAQLSQRLGQGADANVYFVQAANIHASFDSFWDGSINVYRPTRNLIGGDVKPSGLDSQVILGILHSRALSWLDPRVMATETKLINTFRGLYSINASTTLPGMGMGRYPEDRYDGGNNLGGNPWFLITAAFANASYQAAQELIAQGQQSQAQSYLNYGDLFLECLRAHTDGSGSLSEQFDRNSGYMTSARDLTWSHVEFLRAKWARDSARQDFGLRFGGQGMNSDVRSL